MRRGLVGALLVGVCAQAASAREQNRLSSLFAKQTRQAVLFARQAVTTGLVGHWALDTVAGTTTPGIPSDATLRNAATVGAGPTAAPGVFGGGLAFDGTDDNLVVADTPALNFGAGSFTVACWIKPSQTDKDRVLNKWDGTNQQGWFLDINMASGGTVAAGNLRFRIDSSTTSNLAADNLDYSVAAGLGTGAWRHFAATVDRAAGKLKLYVDGAPVGTPQTIVSTITSVSNAMQLGIGTIAGTPANYYGGGLDDVRLYNRALSAAEVVTLVKPLAPTLTSAVGAWNPSPQATLTWTASAGSLTYRVYRSQGGGTPIQVASGVTGTTYVDATVTMGATYTYTVRGFNVLESADSNALVVTIPIPPPRTNDHEEGYLDGRCGCGSVGNPWRSALVLSLLVFLGLVAALSRR